jgi:tRNA/tmRNA/rRNA uracil-C5-methylase (TrmA/RlmC/RlmD family)
LVLSETALANPNNRTFNASADDVFRAAKKAAAGHRILIPQDEGLKDLTDSGQEIQSFQFATTLPGVTFRVIAEISVEPQPDGTTKLGMFFHRDRPYVPSSSLELREQQLQNQLESKIATLEQEKDKYETRYEVIHDIDLETYVAKQKEIHKKEYEAKLEEIEQEREARLADLAGMPTSSFPTMDTAADKFFKLVEQNLQGGKTKPMAGVNH